MKVALHVGQLLQRVPGGIGRYVTELRGALDALGVDVIPFAAGDPSVHRLAALPGYVDLGHPWVPMRYELWHRLRRPVVRIPADVVHAPSLAVPPTGRTPLVVTVNDVAFVHHPEAFTRRGVAFHRRGLELARRHAASVVVPSEFTRDELVALGFDDRRLFVARHGVAVTTTTPDDEVATRLRRVAVTEPYLLAVGTIEPRKNLPTLAAAIARVRREHAGLRLVLAGPRGWGEVPGLDTGWVRELGAVDDATLHALYRGAVACGIPSRYEGFGMPALEAMARGCPVIASDVASLPEVVGDAGVLVAPDDLGAWAQALTALLDDPARRAELVRRGTARAAGFTWETSARAHLDAYAGAIRIAA